MKTIKTIRGKDRSSVYQYISPKSSNTDISNSATQNNRSSDLHGLLFTLTITGWEIWTMTFKQMLLRLPIAPAQVKAGNRLDNSLNEIRAVTYSYNII